jgi:hypothetical protein
MNKRHEDTTAQGHRIKDIRNERRLLHQRAFEGKDMRQAVFLDRDGTINEDVGYVCSMEEFILVPRAVEALRLRQN